MKSLPDTIRKAGLPQTSSQGGLVRISDCSIEVGVIPALGGMVALLNIAGKPNILKADPALWERRPPVRRRFGANPAFEANNGHIVWLGPQSEWWAHQDKNPKKRGEAAVWPPDPYINQGHFDVIERSGSRIVTQSQESEFTGVKLTKSVEIKNGKVLFSVTAQNIRKTPVSWDLWLNTRVDGYAKCYAPVASLDRVRIDGKVDQNTCVTAFSHDGQYIRIDPREPSKSKKERWAKAFIPASMGMMAAFTSGQALIIKFKKHAAKLIHPEHALIEFYNYTNRNRADALTELEYHAPYVTLKPGETMSAKQTWEVYPFKSNPSHKECVEFLRSRG